MFQVLFVAVGLLWTRPQPETRRLRSLRNGPDDVHPPLHGQSFLIALTKTAGSALAGFTAWKGGRIPSGTALLPVLMVATLVWNLCYVFLVHQRARRDGISLWRL
jgi:hypothetical protein